MPCASAAFRPAWRRKPVPDRDPARHPAPPQPPRETTRDRQEQQRNQRQRWRQDRGQQERDDQHGRAHRHGLDMRNGLCCSRNVAQQQRLHPRLSDRARERPAAACQSRCRAQPDVRFIATRKASQHNVAAEQEQGPRRHRRDEQGEGGDEPLIGTPFRRPRGKPQQARIAAVNRDRRQRNDQEQTEALGERAEDHQRQREPQPAAGKSSIIGKQSGDAARLRPAQFSRGRRRGP